VYSTQNLFAMRAKISSTHTIMKQDTASHSPKSEQNNTKNHPGAKQLSVEHPQVNLHAAQNRL